MDPIGTIRQSFNRGSKEYAIYVLCTAMLHPYWALVYSTEPGFDPRYGVDSVFEEFSSIIGQIPHTPATHNIER